MSTRSVLLQSSSPLAKVFSDVDNIKSDECLRRIIKYSERIDGKEDARDTLFLILPKSDNTGAFLIGYGIQTDDNLFKLAEKYKIEWVRAGSLNEISMAMEKIDKISHLLICGHGHESGVALSASESNPMNDSNSLTVSNIRIESFPHLSDTAHILFNSCSTGAGTGLNIAKKTSMLFHKATCIAPNEVSFPGLTWVYINSEGPNLLQLNKPLSKCLTQIYRNGIVSKPQKQFLDNWNGYSGSLN